MTNGVLPVRRAYSFALDTIHAGVSDMPYMRESWPISHLLLGHTRNDTATHQVQHLACGDKIVQAVHNLLDGGIPVPLRIQHTSQSITSECDYPGSTHPVDVENVNVVRLELLQGRLDGNVHGLYVVADIVGLLLDVGRTSLEVGRILQAGIPNNISIRSIVFGQHL